MSTKAAEAVAKMPAGRSCGVLRARSKKVMMMTGNMGDVLTNWDDMIACNMPKSSVMDAYQKEFGTKPDDVHLNDDFCKHYGWLSYNNVGDVTYYNVAIKPMTNVESERILTNTTDTPYTQSVKLSTTVSNSATVTVTSASSVSASNTITVGSEAFGIEDEFSQSFTFSNEVGSSSTQSISVTITDTVNVTVPPHSKVKMYIQVKWDSRTQDWDMPVEIDPYGMTGAQFPKPVGDGGHYHWGVSHGYFFNPPFMSKIRGTLLASYNTTGEVVVEPASRV